MRFGKSESFLVLAFFILAFYSLVLKELRTFHICVKDMKKLYHGVIFLKKIR